MTTGRVSVIVPMHNASKHIEQCLSSVAGQTAKGLEVVLVDDCSADDTVRKAEKYPYEIIKLAARARPGAARNRGARKASGAILVFIDSDVVLNPDSVERIVTCLSEPDTDAVSGTYSADMAQTGFFSQLQNLMSAYRQSNLPELVAFTNSAFCAVKRAAFEDAGGYDETMSYYEDVEIGHRLTRKGYRCRSIPELTVTHLKQFSHLGLLGDYFKKAAAAAACMRKNRFERIGSEELPTSLKVAGMSSGLLLLAVPFVGMTSVPFFLFLGAYSIAIAPLLRFLAGQRDLVFGVKAYFACYEICLVSLCAMAYGALAGVNNDRTA